MNGRVFLIGAGPGDPGLLTLRAAELLSQVDVVLYDGLCNADVLAHCPHARQICVGKHGQSRLWTQPEIIEQLLAFARDGKKVARLKGGDPAVFARTAEEAEALRAAGIPFEIVPGITAALAAASYAGIPITHRNHASAVALVTGHEEPGKTESALDWSALARFPGTLVIYMGVTTARTWTQALMENGKDQATPTAILRNCSLPHQQTIHCRLDQVAEYLTPASKFRPPVIVIVGTVTQLASTMAWFEQRPLFGKVVLVTRNEQQANELSEPLREQGASVIEQAAIQIEPPQNWQAVDCLLDSLSDFDYLVFTSRNGVKYFLDRMLETGHDLRSLHGVLIAVVGQRTAEALAEYHLKADVIPTEFNARALAAELLPHASGKRFAIVRAERGQETLQRELEQAGAQATPVIAYTHRDVTSVSNSILKQMQAGKIDYVTATSRATFDALRNLFGDALHKTNFVSLSPSISSHIRSAGFAVVAEAEQATMADMVSAILASSPSAAMG